MAGGRIVLEADEAAADIEEVKAWAAGRKHGWQPAEHAGEVTADGKRRLLATADWDPDLVRDYLRADVLEHLGDPGGVLAVDKTGFPGARLHGVAAGAAAATGSWPSGLLWPGRNHPARLGLGSRTRWTVEESFQAKTEVGLDHHQVRRWRLLVAPVWTTPIQPGFVLAWSGWRHRRAQRAHYSRRERQHWLQS